MEEVSYTNFMEGAFQSGVCSVSLIINVCHGDSKLDADIVQCNTETTLMYSFRFPVPIVTELKWLESDTHMIFRNDWMENYLLKMKHFSWHIGGF